MIVMVSYEFNNWRAVPNEIRVKQSLNLARVEVNPTQDRLQFIVKSAKFEQRPAKAKPSLTRARFCIESKSRIPGSYDTLRG